jgi:hypothetical protein
MERMAFLMFVIVAKIAANSIDWITATGAPSSSWYCSAMSNNGQFGIAGSGSGDFIYITTDFGESWSISSLGQFMYANGVALSDDARHAVVVGNSDAGAQIWISNDNMNTWHGSTGPVTNVVLQATAMSGSGLYSAVVENGGMIWTSSNYGTSFSITGAPALDWTAVKMSGSGQIVVAMSALNGIYYSHDFGTTWTASNAPNGNWATALAMNEEGNIVIAGVIVGGPIFVSSDFGVTWTETEFPVPRPWHTIACDATGQYVMAAGDGTAMYLSADYGQFWVRSGDASYGWKGLALSSSGVNTFVFRADKFEDDTYSDTSIYFATYPFASIAAGSGDDGGDSATPSPDIHLVIIVIPCSVGGMALLLLVYFYCCVPRARLDTTASSGM